MQDGKLINNREQVNFNIGKLPRLGQTKRSVWFNKRRYGNL
jgi:hypothetical protein